MRGKLTKLGRMVLSALIVIEVHARDVVAKMVEEEVKNVNDFEWISQLRSAYENTLQLARPLARHKLAWQSTRCCCTARHTIGTLTIVY